MNFNFSKEIDKERVMHWKIDDMEVKAYDKAHEVIHKCFQQLLYRYQIGLKISKSGCDFIFHCVYLLHCKCHKKNRKHGGS